MRYFVEQCKEHISYVFDCERTNVMLVDRFNKQFYVPFFDEEIEFERTKTYPIDRSLASSSVVSGHGIFTEKVSQDSRFNRDFDDPDYEDAVAKNQNFARQIMTCPIYATNDKTSQDGDIEKLPRAIIQVINKKHENFMQEDFNRLEMVCFVLGRCHDCMLKMEQIYALKSFSFELMSCTDVINTNLEQNEVLYRNLKETFKEFLEGAEKRAMMQESM